MSDVKAEIIQDILDEMAIMDAKIRNGEVDPAVGAAFLLCQIFTRLRDRYALEAKQNDRR